MPDTVKAVAGRLALGGMFFVAGVAWEAPPVIIGAFIVVASCIPLWRKAKRAATSEGQGAESRAQIQEFLLDAEDRQLRAIADFEEQAAQRLADIEERIDFHERLLIKSRQQQD